MRIEFLSDLIGESAAHTVTTLIVIMLILFLTWLVRKLLESALPKLIDKLTARTNNRLDDRLFKISAAAAALRRRRDRPVVATLVINFSPAARDVISRVMSSLLAISLFWAAHRAVSLIVFVAVHVGRRTWHLSEPGRTTAKLENAAEQLLKALIIVLGVMVILEEWDYHVGGLVAGLGSVVWRSRWRRRTRWQTCLATS